MSRMTVRIVAVATVLGTMLALTGVALGAGSLRPTLGPPNHKRVHAGRITLKVKDPAAIAQNTDVFVSISPKRKTNKYGELKSSCSVSKRCNFVELKRWKGHPGWWIYKAPGFNFPGYWATTPGKLYWQAEHADCTHFSGCEATSKIGSFKVVG